MPKLEPVPDPDPGSGELDELCSKDIDVQIYKDLDKWADKRLHQWFVDTHDRFQQGGLSDHKAFLAAAAVLLKAAVDVMAFTEVDPREAGEMFMHLIDTLQRAARARAAKSNKTSQ